MNSITGLLFILLVCRGVTASGGNGTFYDKPRIPYNMIENSSTSVRFYYCIFIGNGWCCSILNKYPDMIPIQKWETE